MCNRSAIKTECSGQQFARYADAMKSENLTALLERQLCREPIFVHAHHAKHNKLLVMAKFLVATWFLQLVERVVYLRVVEDHSLSQHPFKHFLVFGSKASHEFVNVHWSSFLVLCS